MQLSQASPADADRCPHCGRHLGIPRVGPLAEVAERALGTLVRTLGELAGHGPSFRVDPESVLGPVREALAAWGATTTRAA